MDTGDTTVIRGRGNSCYKPIAMIAVIAGIYVSIVSVLRFGRFLAAFNTAPPSDDDFLSSGSRKFANQHCWNHTCVLRTRSIVNCYLLSIMTLQIFWNIYVLYTIVCECVCNENIVGNRRELEKNYYGPIAHCIPMSGSGEWKTRENYNESCTLSIL